MNNYIIGFILIVLVFISIAIINIKKSGNITTTDVSLINKGDALAAALRYLEKEYGITEQDYPLYAVTIKQYNTGQSLGYVSESELTYFKVTVNCKLLIAQPGESLYTEFVLWMNESGEIPAANMSVTESEEDGVREVVAMRLTPEKVKIKDEINQILEKEWANGRNVSTEMSVSNPLTVKVIDEGYEIIKGEIAHPTYRYRYNNETGMLREFTTGLETTGPNYTIDPHVEPEPEGTEEFIKSLEEYLKKNSLK